MESRRQHIGWQTLAQRLAQGGGRGQDAGLGDLEGLDAPVADGDEVTLLPAVAGGAV